jgi:Holliday junction resolvase RusA-like endonuclease
LRFFLNFEPDIPTLTHQQGIKPFVRKNGKPGIRKTPELESLEQLFEAKLAQFAPPAPWDCPIKFCASWTFLRPQSVRSHWKTTKPDTDNLQKLLKDAMTKCGFWKDDALVCVEIVEKIYHEADEKHGIAISISNLEEPEEP